MDNKPLPYAEIKAPKRIDTAELRELLGDQRVNRLLLRWAAKHGMAAMPRPLLPEHIDAARRLLNGERTTGGGRGSNSTPSLAYRPLYAYAFQRRKPFLTWLATQEASLNGTGPVVKPKKPITAKRMRQIRKAQKAAVAARKAKRRAA